MLTPYELPFKTLTLVDNKKDNILQLHQDGAYRWIKGRFVINMTNTATPPTFKEDNVLNYIKSLGIRRNGRLFKFDVSLKVHFLKEGINKGTLQAQVAPVTTASATYDAIVNFTMDFAENILDESDITALLQTLNLSLLELVVSTGAVADIASANAPTINSRTIEIETRYYQGTVKQDGEEIDVNDDTQYKVTDIKEISQIVTLEANRIQYDKNAQDIDLMPNAAILETVIMVLDNGIRSNDRVTDVKFKQAKPVERNILEWVLKHLHEQNKSEYAMETEITGLTKISWQEKLGSRFGLFTGSKSSEILKLLTNGITGTEDTIEIYTRYV